MSYITRLIINKASLDLKRCELEIEKNKKIKGKDIEFEKDLKNEISIILESKGVRIGDMEIFTISPQDYTRLHKEIKKLLNKYNIEYAEEY